VTRRQPSGSGRTTLLRDSMSLVRLIFALALAALVGCDRTPVGPPLAPVSGTVTLDDRPLGGAMIALVPIGSTLGWGGTCRTADDGRYELVERKTRRPGVPTGEYKVVIGKRATPEAGDAVSAEPVPPQLSAAREQLPPRYSDVGQTELRATVGPDGGTIDFPLETQRAEVRR